MLAQDAVDACAAILAGGIKIRSRRVRLGVLFASVLSASFAALVPVVAARTKPASR
jgi:hypothetical protein